MDAGDISALVLEILDGDGDDPEDTPGGTFLGSPVGSDPNQDGIADAGDTLPGPAHLRRAQRRELQRRRAHRGQIRYGISEVSSDQGDTVEASDILVDATHHCTC